MWAVLTFARDGVGERVEDPTTPGVPCPCGEGAHPDVDAVRAGRGVDPHVGADGVLENGRRRELELVDPVVRQIQARPETGEHELDDAAPARRGRDRDRDDLRHPAARGSAGPNARTLAAMEGAEFEIIVDTSATARRIAVRGDLDLATVDSLGPALDAAIEAGAATTLVLTDCTFLDSSALKMIADASRRANESGTTFAVSHPSHAAARVLEVSGLDEIVTIETTDSP